MVYPLGPVTRLWPLEKVHLPGGKIGLTYHRWEGKVNLNGKILGPGW